MTWQAVIVNGCEREVNGFKMIQENCSISSFKVQCFWDVDPNVGTRFGWEIVETSIAHPLDSPSVYVKCLT